MKIEKIPYQFSTPRLRGMKASNFTSGWGQYRARRETGNSRAVTSIAGFHCHAIKIKIENHSMNEVKKFTRYRQYINKYSVQASGLCGIPYSSYLT